MFTGLIRHVGRIAARQPDAITIECQLLIPRLELGDSVAVNGACLTVSRLNQDGFSADLLAETRLATTLGALDAGRRVNLELPLAAGEPLGGHFVQGHVDGTARLLEKSSSGSQWRYVFDLPPWLAPLAIPKGSVAIDGVSLTIQELRPDSFAVALIAATYNETALGDISPGEKVNVEADMLVKAVRRIVDLTQGDNRSMSLTELKELGYGK